MKKVVFYARVSTDEQTDSLQNQTEEITDYINSNEDWILVDQYIDEGRSGTDSKKRKEYQRLFTDLLTDKFDIVVIRDISRLNRNVFNWYQFIDRLTMQEKKLFFLDTKSFYKADDKLLTGVRALIAEQYSQDLSRKLNNAQRQRMNKGVVVTNNKMWGYEQKEGKLVIKEDEAKIVRYIFKRYSEGAGFRIIKNELEEKGITNRNGNEFALTTLKRMIKNEKYKGVLICGKKHKDFETKKIKDVPETEWVVHEDIIPAIVDKELWSKANEILGEKRKVFNIEEKRKIHGYFQGKHIYSGKIKCGICNRPYYHSCRNNCKDLKFVWECKGYREHGINVDKKGCNNVKLIHNQLDGIVKEIIFDFWKTKDHNIRKIIDILDKTLEVNNYDESISKLIKDKIKVEQKKDKLLDLYSDDLITKEEFKKKNEDYQKQLSQIENLIFDYESKNKNIVDKKQRFLKIEKILNETCEDKDSINDKVINYFLKEICVYKDNLKITLNGNFEIIANKINDEYIYHNVATARYYWTHYDINKYSIEIYVEI